MSYQFDVNCDLGEGYGNDAKIMPFINSCNIACGGHFGDTASIQEIIDLANNNKVNIGAHPSYPDKINFGRKIMKIEDSQLLDSIYKQIETINDVCIKSGSSLHHIKLHGALYNVAAQDKGLALKIRNVFAEFALPIKIFAPYGSIFSRVMSDKFQVWEEAFVDRAYNNDLSLVDRSHSQAVINDHLQCLKQFKNMVQNRQVQTIQGQTVNIKPQTYCVHGDLPHTLSLLPLIKEFVERSG